MKRGYKMNTLEITNSEELDCLDGMVIYGMNGDVRKYNECKLRIDEYLVEEAIKEYGIDEALKEKVITQEEVLRYLEKTKFVA
jgi:hypothetical protein